MNDEPDPARAAKLAPLQLSPTPSAPTPSPSPEPGSPYPKCELLPRLLARLFDLMVCGALVVLMHRAGAAAGALYLLLADGLFRGQSFGKRMLGIQVVHVPTRRGAGARQSMLRNFPMAVVALVALGPSSSWRLLSAVSLAILGYEAFRIVLNPLGLRIGDTLARTQVVDAKAVLGAPALVGAANSTHSQAAGMRRVPRHLLRRRAEWVGSRAALDEMVR